MKAMLLVAVTLAAFAGAVSLARATAANGVQGTVVRGPTAPVCIVGRPCSRPVAGALVTVRHVSSAVAAVAARGRTDLRGRFRFALPPDSYLVTVTMGTGIRSRTSVHRVLVQSGRFTTVRFVFDTGIR
jgi:hypothetical protein